MLPDCTIIEEAVRQWAAAAGVRVDQIALSRKGRPVLVLPITGGNGEPSEPKGKTISPVVSDILTILEEADKPLTTTRILQALAKKGIEWSERAVSGHLARLVEEGTLQNCKDPERPGYSVRS